MATIAPQPDNGMDKKPPHPEPPRADGDTPDDQRVYPREIEYPGPGAIRRVEEIETGIGLDARQSRALAKVVHDAVREGLKQQNREMRLCFRAIYNMLDSVERSLGERIDRLEKKADERHARSEEGYDRAERKADERHARSEERYDRAERKADERYARSEEWYDRAERKADERHARSEEWYDRAERKADERYDKLVKKMEEGFADSKRFMMWMLGLLATLALGVLAILVHRFDSALDRIASIAQHPPALVETAPPQQPHGDLGVQADGLDGNAGAMPGSGVEPVPQGDASPAGGTGGGGSDGG